MGGLAQQIIYVGVRLQGDAGFIFPDVGLHGGGVVLACHRDAVVPVADEVDLADFIKFDGRETAAGGDQPVHSPPPLSHALLPGEEGAGEILIAAHAAHDVIQGYILKPQVALVVQLQPPAHLFKRQEVGRALRERGQHVLGKGGLPGLFPLLNLYLAHFRPQSPGHHRPL